MRAYKREKYLTMRTCWKRNRHFLLSQRKGTIARFLSDRRLNKYHKTICNLWITNCILGVAMDIHDFKGVKNG